MATAEFYYDPLECTICLGRFRSPKILPCFHSFCLVCLEKHVSKDTVPASVYRFAYFNCPLCRKETPLPQGGVENFQTNFYIEDEQEKDDTEDPVSSAVQGACDKLAIIDLQLEFNSHDKGPRARELQHAVNGLANMRYGASRYSSRISGLHSDAREYATKLMSSAYEVRKEIENARQKAVDLVNAACNETLEKLDEVVGKERNRVEDYMAQLDGLVDKSNEFECEAVNGQLTGTTGGSVTEIMEKLTGDYKEMIDTFPSDFGEKKSLVLQLASDAFWQNATAQNICGKVLFEIKQDGRCSEAMGSVLRRATVPEITKASSINHTCDSPEEPAAPDSSHGVNGSGSFTRGVSDGSPLMQEPQLVRLIDAPQPWDVRHIVRHTVHQQAWISYGQREHSVYLFDIQGGHIDTVNASGDAHDITVLDGNTLVVANPAQKRLRQVAAGPDDDNPDHVPGHHTYILPFPATCVAYHPLLNILAYAGKNNLQIISTVTGQAQVVVNGQTIANDILTRPSSLAFSHMEGHVVLAAADLGTSMVYMFLESDDPQAKFSKDDMFMYSGEGLYGYNQRTPFNPVSVSGRHNLLAVLDKTTNSIALLGQMFSLIGIVRLDSLGLAASRCLAFTDNTENCWQVWLGTVAGSIAVVDLPQFLCHS